MTWLRTGDTAVSHPTVTAIAAVPGADKCQVFGFVSLLATMSAAHLTDYRVDFGMAHTVAGDQARKLLSQAVKAGLLTVTGKGASRVWQIINDPELFHIRLRLEVEIERRRAEDKRNPDLIAAVRQRDGDQCRWCGNVVNWRDRKGNRAATYDHLDIQRPTSPDTLVVACDRCNKRRGLEPDRAGRFELRPAPRDPYYSKATVAHLKRLGVTVKESTTKPEPQGAECEDPGLPHPSGRGTRSRDRPGPGTDLGLIPDKSLIRPDRHSDCRDGPGRDGSGRVWPGGARAAPPPADLLSPSSPPAARRSRRGGRRRHGRDSS